MTQQLNLDNRSRFCLPIRQQNQSLQFSDRSYDQVGHWAASGHDVHSLSSGYGLAPVKVSRNSIDMYSRQKLLSNLHNLIVHHQGLVPVLYKLL